jgi:hypothetical protein
MRLLLIYSEIRAKLAQSLVQIQDVLPQRLKAMNS